MTATPELRVELIRWPAEQARREACLERGVIRLLVVEGGRLRLPFAQTSAKIGSGLP